LDFAAIIAVMQQSRSRRSPLWAARNLHHRPGRAIAPETLLEDTVHGAEYSSPLVLIGSSLIRLLRQHRSKVCSYPDAVQGIQTGYDIYIT